MAMLILQEMVPLGEVAPLEEVVLLVEVLPMVVDMDLMVVALVMSHPMGMDLVWMLKLRMMILGWSVCTERSTRPLTPFFRDWKIWSRVR